MSSPAWELLYWRGADPSPPAPFRESCYCVQCREYFGLLLVPAASARGPGVTVLATGDEPFEQRPCFCPQCHEEYPQYGILGGDATPLPDQVHVLHVGVFPPGRPRSRVVRVNGAKVDQFVLLVTGPVPPRAQIADFAVDVTDYILRSVHPSVGDGVVRGGAVPHHVLWVSTLCDETDWLVPVLDAHVFGGAMGVRMFGSSPEIGNSAGTRLILCSIRPSSWGAR